MKLKTHKATAKRIKVANGKKKKLLVKRAGQDHFNARETGKVTRRKRRGHGVAKADEKTIRRAIPHS